MTAAERLAAIYSDLAATGLPCLVLGGHAVRYYGIDRNEAVRRLYKRAAMLADRADKESALRT